jgi:hypothetical protein
MIFKIFVKIDKNKVPVVADDMNKYYEADEVLITPPTGNSITKFELFVKGIDDYVPIKGEINLDTHGYELTNANGIIIERYISKINL